MDRHDVIFYVTAGFLMAVGIVGVIVMGGEGVSW